MPKPDLAFADFLPVARERGYLYQVTDAEALAARMAQGPLSGYIVFDCTADSLHVGSLMQIMLLRLMQRCGHRPVVLMGGGTTKVGDPSFRDEARPLLDDAQIERNKAGIRQVFDHFLTFGVASDGAPSDGAPSEAIMLDNAAWLMSCATSRSCARSAATSA
jgi:tyrosyl-tRNA synthetase